MYENVIRQNPETIKRCFKLIYYVNSIDKEIFMEFLKSHGQMRVKKFYIWRKNYDHENRKGRFRLFDVKGFIKEYEEVFPNVA